MKLFYLPVEMYKERWTEFVSGPDGMFERQVKELGVDIIPVRPHTNLMSINSGRVLDPLARCKWSFAQTEDLVRMILNGDVTKDDKVYIEDFWHPGMEMIPYAMSLAGLGVGNVYTFNHAQSIDPYDFTNPMAYWMRDFEQAWAMCNSGVFCAAQELVELMKKCWQKPSEIFHATGTVFAHEVLYKIAGVAMSLYDPLQSDRKKTVVYSSRWDTEKNPGFFCLLAQEVLNERSDVNFVVCTSADKLRSNDPQLVRMANGMQARYKYRFEVLEELSKRAYYQILDESKVQFNCADQDFVSYTLLEAAAFGCAPLYPDYLTFPDALHNHPAHLYEKGSLIDAKCKLYTLLDSPQQDYSWAYMKYERSVARMLKIMGFDVWPGLTTLAEDIAAGKEQVLKEIGQ